MYMLSLLLVSCSMHISMLPNFLSQTSVTLLLCTKQEIVACAILLTIDSYCKDDVQRQYVLINMKFDCFLKCIF